MKAGIIHLDYVEIMGVTLREIIEKLLEVVGVHTRIFLKKERTGHRLYRPIQIKGFELPLDFDVGLTFFSVMRRRVIVFKPNRLSSCAQ